MKVMKEDIVELMSLNKHNNEGVEVGWRFKVETVFDDLVEVKIPNKHYMSGLMLVKEHQVFLYHRPFKNTLLNIFN